MTSMVMLRTLRRPGDSADDYVWTGDVEGIDAGGGHRLVRRARRPACSRRSTFELIAGGHSNLTFGVTDAAGGD